MITKYFKPHCDISYLFTFCRESEDWQHWTRPSARRLERIKTHSIVVQYNSHNPVYNIVYVVWYWVVTVVIKRPVG